MKLRGLYLIPPHGTWIHTGRKKAVLKSRPYRMAYEPLVLVEGKLALGIVVLSEPEVLSPEEAALTEALHRVSAEERARWWPGASQLYLYRVAAYHPFPRPLPVEVPKGVQTFLSEVDVPEDFLPRR